ncbi:hypothetical protein [Thermochromatium tepidum]|uniref:Transposase n=1 Tax=Thermochromatium tepidum ATCC 43061 TaxID=316276 RepID=A0A6I6E582_THETI|nr:hypothetical protein [Thermochromatium tepidum]QGU32992.1 hypothetical protein E6P07_08385 [Thermochromatium tepidum ATCC 43061]
MAVGQNPRQVSRRRAKAKLRVARLDQRIKNRRRVVLHERLERLTRTDRVIRREDLNIKGLAKNRRRARAVSDAGLG